MRNELEIIEKIERYLTGHMSAEEWGAFEKELESDPDLRQKVALQRELMGGIERIAIKQEIKLAGQNYAVKNKLIKFGFGGAGLLILALAVFYFVGRHPGHSMTSNADYYGTNLPAYNETGGTNWASADSNLKAQVFYLDAAKDTVIETEQGIVFSIPANGFLDKDKQTVKGQYSLYIKEALDAASIMKAGLSSMSGNDLLESAGMFFLDARKDGAILSIDASKGIYAQVPAANIKGGMQLFSGKRMPNGTIDWVNPKPLVHDLVPVDILSLDFYPPHYLDSVAKWGYNNRDKKFTDSLYYSLAEYFHYRNGVLIDSISEQRLENYEGGDAVADNEEAPKLPPGDDYDDNRRNVKPATSLAGNRKRDASVSHPETYSADTSRGPDSYACGINPAKIKTIWSSKYQNTLLATREFQERIKVIHQFYSPDILDLYIRRLDRNLYETDSIAATIVASKERSNKIFLEFAARHNGKVNISSIQFKMLKAYYEMKTKAYTIAITKIQEEYRTKQSEMGLAADHKRYENDTKADQRTRENFKKELTINMKEAYRQLGYNVNFTATPPAANAYTVNISTTGWSNVDKYVVESTISRTTLDYTDKSTGKKAVIKYEPVTVNIDNANAYDRLYVYALPAELNSFVRLPFADGQYQYKLNELIKYNLVCIAWKGTQAYYYAVKEIKPQKYDRLVLTAIASDELNKKLASKGDGMKREQDYMKFEYYDKQRRDKNLAWQELRLKLFVFISPCLDSEHDAYYMGILKGK